MGIAHSIDLTADQHKMILALFDQYLPNTTVWAFGSRVKWTSTSKSDLDLVVFANEEQCYQVASLREQLEESDLPFRVDLLVWDELPQEFKKEIKTNALLISGSRQRYSKSVE